jgi:hypothetical protein
MTTPFLPAEPKSRRYLVVGAGCLAFSWMLGIAATALGVRITWPHWLMLVAATGMLGSRLLGPTRPRAEEYLVVATAVLSVAAAIGMIASQL